MEARGISDDLGVTGAAPCTSSLSSVLCAVRPGGQSRARHADVSLRDGLGR